MNFSFWSLIPRTLQFIYTSDNIFLFSFSILRYKSFQSENSDFFFPPPMIEKWCLSPDKWLLPSLSMTYLNRVTRRRYLGQWRAHGFVGWSKNRKILGTRVKRRRSNFQTTIHSSSSSSLEQGKERKESWKEQHVFINREMDYFETLCVSMW